MSSSENLLRAAVHSIKARIKKTISYSAFETAAFIKEAPELIKKEWNEFKEEVSTQAEQLDKSEAEEIRIEEIDFQKEGTISPKNRIEQIRKKITALNNQVEEIH